jgi:hypothetical protein
MNDARHAADRTNRLSIGHLLLWMATTGAVLAFLQAFVEPLRPFEPSERGFEPKYRFFLLVMWIMNRSAAPAYGVALAGGALAAWRTVTQRPGFPTHPGHWLLLAVGAWTVTLATIVCLSELLRVADSVQGVVLTALMLATASISGIGAFRATRQGTDVWVFSFIALTIVAGVIALFGLVVAFSDPPSAPPLMPLFVLALVALLVAAVTTLIAACIDLLHGRKRDLFHWAGIASSTLIIAHPFMRWLSKMLTIG